MRLFHLINPPIDDWPLENDYPLLAGQSHSSPEIGLVARMELASRDIPLLVKSSNLAVHLHPRASGSVSRVVTGRPPLNHYSRPMLAVQLLRIGEGSTGSKLKNVSAFAFLA